MIKVPLSPTFQDKGCARTYYTRRYKSLSRREDYRISALDEQPGIWGEAVLKSYETSQAYGLIRQSDTPVAHQQIRSQLAKISASEEFQRSKRSLRFLNYIVEETLAGRASRIKAYSVAISVLDRDDTFDPQTDPMVRIEASQLRRRLERYYLTQGATDPVVIDLPKGGYVPVFRLAEVSVPPDLEPKPGTRRFTGRVVWVASATALMTVGIVGIVTMLVSPSQNQSMVFNLHSTPTLQVLPFSATTLDERSAVVAAGLADEVTQVLTRHGTVGVLGPASGATGASHAGAAMLLTGSVRSNAGVIRLTASLIDARRGTYIWTEAYDTPADGPVLTIQTALAIDLGVRLAISQGVTARLPESAQAEADTGGGNLQ
jgi:TolB-like protein